MTISSAGDSGSSSDTVRLRTPRRPWMTNELECEAGVIYQPANGSILTAGQLTLQLHSCISATAGWGRRNFPGDVWEAELQQTLNHFLTLQHEMLVWREKSIKRKVLVWVLYVLNEFLASAPSVSLLQMRSVCVFQWMQAYSMFAKKVEFMLQHLFMHPLKDKGKGKERIRTVWKFVCRVWGKVTQFTAPLPVNSCTHNFVGCWIRDKTPPQISSLLTDSCILKNEVQISSIRFHDAHRGTDCNLLCFTGSPPLCLCSLHCLLWFN